MKNTKIFFTFFFLHFKKKTIEKTKNSLFDQNYSEIINSMNFIIFLFQSDKNDENNNLRMNKLNWKQLILFNLIVLNESLFLLNWEFQLMNFLFFIWLILFKLRNSIKSSKRWIWIINLIEIFFSSRWEDNLLSNELSISMKW